MDSIFFHTTYKGHGSKAQIKEISVIRANDASNVIASHTELLLNPTTFEQEKLPANALGAIRDSMLQEKFDKQYYVVVFHDIHKQLLRSLEGEISTGTTTPEELFKDRMWIDLMQITFPMVIKDRIQDRSLKGLIAHFGLSGYTGCSSAQEDVSYLLRVYQRVMSRYSAALSMESTARDLGGEKYDMLKTLFGF